MQVMFTAPLQQQQQQQQQQQANEAEAEGQRLVSSQQLS